MGTATALSLLERRSRRHSMLPGGRRDALVHTAKWLLPLLSALLLLALILMPLLTTREFSFLLSKDNAAHSDERLEVQQAQYRGETTRGEPFTIRAQSAIQQRSDIPVVVLSGLSARIEQQSGPATITAPSGEYYIDENRVVAEGPVVARSASGYSLDGHGIEVDIDQREVRSRRPVSGAIPIGTFRADSFSADLRGREIRLAGKVHLRIEPGKGAVK